MTETKADVPKWVAVGRTVWTGGQAWATCDTPGQAARVAEDMNTVDRMTLMLGAIKAWCSRNGHTYAEKLAMRGLGESVSPPESPTVPVA